MSNPRAVIFGCAGRTLAREEARFFRDSDPLGFILFARNVDTPEQVRALCNELRDTVGRDDAPVLIDQEGGRVQRLAPPHWRDVPAPGVFADLHARNPEAAAEAARLNARLIAHDLNSLGISVDCLPVLDMPQPDSHPFLTGRAAGSTIEQSTLLGRATCEGLLAGGVLPVIKHLPGHGRATVDSHHDLPRVEASIEELQDFDFAPFKALCRMPWAMTAHIVYTAIDDQQPVSTSAIAVKNIIRDAIGFQGFLVSDDIGMNALRGTVAERAANGLRAGLDTVLHCSGVLSEMIGVSHAVEAMSAEAVQRFTGGNDHLAHPETLDVRAATARLDVLLAES